MPDLDQLLDSLVADVRSKTRAPGAPTAIKHARRRRKVVVASGAIAAVAFIAVGGGLAAGTLGGSQGLSSPAGPSTASPEPPSGQEEAAIGERYRTLRQTLNSVPGWAIPDATVADPPAMGRCDGSWLAGSGGVGAGHNLGLSVSPGQTPVGTAEELEFSGSEAASESMDRLIGNLASCKTESWQIQPIGQTGDVLAFSDAGVIWILRKDASVATLHVATADGPPPQAVNVEVADLIYSWFQ